MKHLAYLNKYFYKYRYRFILGIFFVTMSNIFAVLPPQVIRYAFDLVKDNIAYYNLYDSFALQASIYSVFSSILLFFGITMLSLALIQGMFTFMMRQTIIVMSRLIEFDLRNEMYVHYQRLSTAFYKRHRTGDLMSRVTEDVGHVRMYLGPAIMYSINLSVLIFIVVFTMLQVNVELTLYVLLPLPILAISIYYVNRIIHKRSELIQEQLSALTSNAQESFSGIRVLKAYVQENSTNAFFALQSESYKEKSLDLVRVQALFFPLMMVLVGLSTIITIYVGGLQVISGKISPGNIAEFVIYVGMLTWPVASIGWVAAIIQRASASQKRINEFLKEKATIVSLTEEKTDLKGALTFKNVDFIYPDTGIQALKNVNFSLKKGEKMAVIGRTGSGKTTIAELLVRKYDVSKGEVLLDYKNVKAIHLEDIREQIGYVPQDVFLFSETINKNVAFGKQDATEKEIRLAAKQAAILADIDGLPKKFETIVGERGVTLSGGQKQRVSLARALLKNPQILLLDDCLSAVDAKTEETIIDHLNNYLSDKTAIIITHRIFSLMNFDKIIVLDEGRLAEEGTHEELLNLRGLYYDLYEKQQLEEKKMSL
ncbi:MAG: ABC transporter ATP-binding protein [Chitinophagales bacterium]